jgi:anti-sigma regulatory factor (Ser/Thr protein kinase)
MPLRLPSFAVRRAAAATSETFPGIEPQDAEVAWLARQHDQFIRGWGRDWLWRETPRRGDGERASRTIDALTLAALHLEAERLGRQIGRLVDRDAAASLLVPPALIRKEEDVRRCMERLLDARNRVPERLARDAATLVAEMALNVCEHSGSIGAVAATWREAGEDAGLCLAVVDRGVGLGEHSAGRKLGSSRRRGDPSADAAGVQALLVLIAPGERAGEGHGLGLRLSRALVARHHGAMHLRSGSRVVTVGADLFAFTGRCPRRFAVVPGTQICVQLRLATERYVDMAGRIAVS